jgi:hypothetical protein
MGVVEDFGYEMFLKNSQKLSQKGMGFFGVNRRLQTPLGKEFAKANAPLLSSTTAAWNVVYGRMVWNWTNRQVNAWSALAKQKWTSSGVRVSTSDPATWTHGLTEEETLGDSVKPTYAYLKFPLRQLVTRIGYSRKQAILSGSGDDSIPTPEQLRKDAGEGHLLGVNKLMILANAETAAGAASAHYAGGKIMEAFDRLISCNAEENDLGGTHNGWYDPYDGSSYDRDSGTTHDAVVFHADGTNCYQTGNPAFGTDASFDIGVIDDLYRVCMDNGLKTENGFWLTGRDTYMRWKQWVEPKERFFDPVQVQLGVGGARTVTGTKAGFLVSSYYNMPIIIDQNCPKDTISKIFLIDRAHMFLRIATPTIFINNTFPAYIDDSGGGGAGLKLTHDAFYLTEGELCTTRYNTQGKISALK